MALNNLMQTPDDQGIAGGLGTLQKKPRLKSAAAAPSAGIATPPPTAGTRLGQLARTGVVGAFNQGVDALNTGNQIAADTYNTLSYPERYAAGVARDAENAFAGNPQAADAGSVPGALDIAAIPHAYLKSPTQAAAASGNAGSTATQPAAPATAVTKPAATASAAPPLWNQTADQLSFQGAAPQLKSPATAAAAMGGIDSGVTLPGGRKLAYGAMVNGVPTFSDGSGGINGQPGSIPATMTKQDIASLGSRLNTVPASTTALASDSLGYTPSSAQMVSSLVRGAQGPKFAMTPEMLAQSDQNAVANGDWRSAAGTAAHNLAVDAAGAGTYLQRTRALDDLGNMRAGAIKNALATQDNQAQLTRTGVAGQNALDIATLQGQYGLADTQLKTAADLASLQPKQVIRADNTIMQVDPFTHQASPLLDRQGKAVKTDTDQLTEKDISDQATQLIAKQPTLFGLDVNGQIIDPTTQQPRALTADERVNLVQQARAMVTGKGAAPQKPTLDQFLSVMKSSGTKLNADQLKQYYTQKYGS